MEFARSDAMGIRITSTACVMLLVLASCGSSSSSSQPTYDAAIQEGQTAAQELLGQGASAVTIALVDTHRIVWSQAFGLADREAASARRRCDGASRRACSIVVAWSPR